MCIFRLFFGSDWRAPSTSYWGRGAAPYRIVALLLVLGSMVGCADKHDEINSYKIPQPAAIAMNEPAKIKEKLRKQMLDEILANSGTPGRMLAAIIPGQPRAWFLKLSGPTDQVSEAADGFRKFLSELKFEGNSPKWNVPEGWTELPGDTNRFATFLLPATSGKPLELTVTALQMRANGDLNGYLAANVNRWRGQMGLADTEDLELSKSLEQFPLTGSGGQKLVAYFVDFEGTLKSDKKMSRFPANHPPIGKDRPGNIGEKQGPQMPPVRPRLGNSPEPKPLTYTVPEGWQPGELKVMRRAAYEVRDGDKRIDITISTAGGSQLMNVNRWRGQVGLAEVTQAELDGLLQPITVGGIKGYYARMVGPAEQGQSILAAAVDRGGITWFFKLWGDSTLVAKEQQHFETFVKSVKFSGAEGAEHGQ